MLQHEITPFAQAHRNALDEIIETLTLPSHAGSITLTSEYAAEIVKKLQTTKRGFDRFEVCALDEWKQKERYAEIARNCRVKHRNA